MRIRSIKPAFWTDKTMARLSVGARLFYVGLWNLADDAGWLEWDVEEMGAELFPYETPRRRERDMAKWAAELSSTDRIRIGTCGHAVIPRFTEHQHLSGPTRRVETVFNRHKSGCPAAPRGNPPRDAEIGVGSGSYRKGSVRNGSLTRAGAREGLTPERMAADGE